ncbi:MAG: hypothetical protein Q8L10_00690 [Candidatus Moranbacteria bacterium]|nr:hypothetical protein [Candidatus Moranbacteria bacterium]
MSKTKLLLISTLAICGTAFFVPARAQEAPLAPPEQETQAVTVATVNIYDAQITSQENNAIKITFDLSNREQVQPDVRYAVQLIRQNEDQQILVDEKIYPETISLNENETIKKEIEYIAPEYLSGTFKLWLIAKNESGLPLSMNPVGEIALDGAMEYLEIIPDTCYLKVEGEAGDKKYMLGQGVDIRPEEKLMAYCDVQSHFKGQQKFTPNFETHWRTAFGKIVADNKEPQQIQIIDQQEKKTLQFILPQALEPQAYEAILELKNSDNQVVSNKVYFHYVLRGVSATIQNLTLDKDYYQKGETARASFFWAGSADSFPESRFGQVEPIKLFYNISIQNEQKQNCGNIQKQAIDHQTFLDVSDIAIVANCPNPQIKVDIQEESGKILDIKDFSLKSRKIPAEGIIAQEKKNNPIVYGVAIVIILAVISLIAIFFKKRSTNIIVIFLTFIFSGMFLFAEEGRADTYVMRYSVRADINSDWVTHDFVFNYGLNKTSFAPGENVTASLSGTSWTCANSIASAQWEIWIPSTVASGSNGYRASLGTELFSASIPAPAAPGSYYAKMAYSDVRGNLNAALVTGEWNKIVQIPFTVTARAIINNPAPAPSCIGFIPSNATMFDKDNLGITVNTRYTYGAVNTATKCQYYCNSGYTWDGSVCAAPIVYDLKICHSCDFSSIRLGTLVMGRGQAYGAKACKVLSTESSCNGTDVTSAASWTSNDSDIASVDAGGIITGNNDGEARISVRNDRLSDVLKVTVALPLSYCGDKTCDSSENCFVCEDDCGKCLDLNWKEVNPN